LIHPPESSSVSPMTPLKIQRFRLNRVSRHDAEWLPDTLTREGKETATNVVLTADKHLLVQWSQC
jgi:poly-gamma-glutamate capsule biosynthesis protein CapA/YwtB (metallophosphatase superfamily)